MNFLLAGFKEGGGSRRFSFDCVASDRSRTTVTVDADMALARKHEIRLQELPLICVRLLESLGDEGLSAAKITLTEDHMVAIQAEAKNSVTTRKPHKQSRPASPNVGEAWRKPRL
jgi:hypothetical protein